MVGAYFPDDKGAWTIDIEAIKERRRIRADSFHRLRHGQPSEEADIDALLVEVQWLRADNQRLVEENTMLKGARDRSRQTNQVLMDAIAEWRKDMAADDAFSNGSPRSWEGDEK